MLQLLHGLVVADQHGMLHLLLALLPVQFLEGQGDDGSMGQSLDGGQRSSRGTRATEWQQQDGVMEGSGRTVDRRAAEGQRE